MFFSDRDEKPDLIRKIRDLVEIAAIIAAGIWAFYTFIYVNTIVPSFEQPKVDFTLTMTEGATHNNLIAVHMTSQMKNVGLVRAHFLGIVWYVDGAQIRRVERPAPRTVHDGEASLSAYYCTTPSVGVFASGFVTHLGGNYGRDLAIEPGDEANKDWTFYVPSGKFDRLSAYIYARFTRYDDHTIPTTVGWSKAGLPSLTSASSERTVFQFNGYITQLDLHQTAETSAKATAPCSSA